MNYITETNVPLPEDEMEEIPPEREDIEEHLPDIPESENISQTERNVNDIENPLSKSARIKLFFENNELTFKKNICWRKNIRYITPKIIWYKPKKDEVTELESPLHFFRQYFTPDLISSMVEHTNLYAVQQFMKCPPTTIDEMETFIGMHILMGNLHYPRVRCYWEKRLRVPIIADAMPRDRFHRLRTALHFVNVLEKDPNCKDRMWKVRPLYNTLRGRMTTLQLETELCIDEQMIPFKGRLNVKQYVKGKPCPWGIKLFALCGSSGLMYDFLIYQGSTTELNIEQQEVFGLGASVVLKLSERIKEVNIQLYFDNFFRIIIYYSICEIHIFTLLVPHEWTVLVDPPSPQTLL